MTADAERTIRSMQLWPGGRMVYISGDSDGDNLTVHDGYQDKDGRPATEAERRQIRIEELAEQYVERDLLLCDTSLVSDLMQLGSESTGEVANEFSYENVKNLRPDPSDWTLTQCREWLSDNGHDEPDSDNPWVMERQEMLDALDGTGELDDLNPGEMTDDAIREALIAYMEEDGGYDDAWRDAVNAHAEDGEIYQWFRVNNWLGEKLIEVGEAVLENAYGYWWGRQCCGQAVIMDGVFQRIAANYVK